MNSIQKIQKEDDFSLTLTGQPNDLANARSFVTAALHNSKFTKRDIHLIVLAVDEAMSRSMQTDDYEVTLKIDVNDTRVKAEIIDAKNDYLINFSEGKFNKNWAEEQSGNDLSIFVILEIMDEVKYVYRRGYDNILTLIKFVPSYE